LIKKPDENRPKTTKTDVKPTENRRETDGKAKWKRHENDEEGGRGACRRMGVGGAEET
jgi:hypothetical protein